MRCYNIVMTKEKTFCPVCLAKPADSAHHNEGESVPRKITWFCKSCHDKMQQMQDSRGMECSIALIKEARRELGIKLDTDSLITRFGDDGKEYNYLIWTMCYGKTKRYVYQWIGGSPYNEPSTLEIHTAGVKLSFLPRQKLKPGFPGKPEVDTAYLEELRYNKGLTYRDIVSLLRQQGLVFSHTAVAERLKAGKRYIPKPESAVCKLCGNEFTPIGRRTKHCSQVCSLVSQRRLSLLNRGEIHD